MKSFLKKMGYVAFVSLMCLSLFSFKSSNQNEVNLANNFEETFLEVQDYEHDGKQGRITAVKKIAKKAAKQAKKAWEKSTKKAATFAARAALFTAADLALDALEGDNGDQDIPHLTAEMISKEQKIKLSKL